MKNPFVIVMEYAASDKLVYQVIEKQTIWLNFRRQGPIDLKRRLIKIKERRKQNTLKKELLGFKDTNSKQKRKIWSKWKYDFRQ